MKRSREERAVSIKRIFSRQGAETSVVVKSGAKNPEQELIERLEESLKKEHRRNEALTSRVEELEAAPAGGALTYVDGLKRAFSLVEDAEGRPGKRQLAELIQAEIRKVETGADTRIEGVED